MTERTELTSLAPDFVEAAHAIVYCSVATVDSAPAYVLRRSRVMHPACRRWDGQRLTGWLTTDAEPQARTPG